MDRTNALEVRRSLGKLGAKERKKLAERILAMRRLVKPAKFTAVQELRALRGALP